MATKSPVQCQMKLAMPNDNWDVSEGGTGPKYITSKVKRKISLLTCTNILQHGNNGASSWQLHLQQAFVASAACMCQGLQKHCHRPVPLAALQVCRRNWPHATERNGCHGETGCNWCLLQSPFQQEHLGRRMLLDSCRPYPYN